MQSKPGADRTHVHLRFIYVRDTYLAKLKSQSLRIKVILVSLVSTRHTLCIHEMRRKVIDLSSYRSNMTLHVLLLFTPHRSDLCSSSTLQYPHVAACSSYSPSYDSFQKCWIMTPDKKHWPWRHINIADKASHVTYQSHAHVFFTSMTVTNGEKRDRDHIQVQGQSLCRHRNCYWGLCLVDVVNWAML